MEFCCFLVFPLLSQIMFGILHLKTDILNYKEFQIAKLFEVKLISDLKTIQPLL